ncbi:extracellular matrix regulator RemB [Alkalicoccus urumqiensis]|uniref:DUF370 domain-containing protein n=1 Tax=Alkalicoccus urumqiensis TaxID=1548213 RepID=A0A2P6MDI3_ALKUR|nr:extracellular matrix/biofilm biosynthesis regulator RemA family protein [Alkalicoccus urumqiensis]PRO64336.1 DUF370 domain-containing protein [Alkalicoccus urumqiensis]
MFIHLGGDMVLKAERIVAILDHMSEKDSPENQAFMQANRDGKKTQKVTEDPPKSMVITEDTVYLSPISSYTLKRRAEERTFITGEADMEEEESTRS